MSPVLEHSNDDDVEVLVTGFGPFGRFDRNPSWLCTETLHDTYLSLDEAPRSPTTTKGTRTHRRLHIQVVQSSVAYSHVLDMVPRIHGVMPSAPEAHVYFDDHGEPVDPKTNQGAQGNGASFPEGYRTLRVPSKGHFDHVIHVGVGSPGAVAIETLAHKRGYQLIDVQKHKAPVATDQSSTTRREAVPSAAEQREMANMSQLVIPPLPPTPHDPIRGFGVGYEPFEDELRTPNDVAELVRWLVHERNHKHIRQSTDAGRFLCDYIFYCSLCEAQRTESKTRVQFIHVPPTDKPYNIQESHTIVKDIIWWLAAKEM